MVLCVINYLSIRMNINIKIEESVVISKKENIWEIPSLIPLSIQTTLFK